MSRFDLVIFGATGFTGKHAVMECARIEKKRSPLTWAIAGRSQSKLEAVLQEASQKTGYDLSAIKIILADVRDENSIVEMCRQAKVVVNCCGPYRLYGEPVVKAAVESKTHYVDVNGEPQFMEMMQLRYDELARAAGVYIISACGFDSIPNDMGVVFLEKNFNGTLNSVESYISMYVSPQYRSVGGSAIHYGTWESIVYGVTHYYELPGLRKQLYPNRLPAFKPKLQARSVIHQNGARWCLPFPGSDGSVVYRTQRYLFESEKKRPVQFKAYIKFPSIFLAMLVLIGAGLLFIFTRTSFTRRLLLNYPRLFSFGAVTKGDIKEELMNNTHFKMELHGVGWEKGADVEATEPNKRMVAKVSGTNPGYGATVVALLYSALTILDENDKMPATGGVMTTGAAFKNTSLIEKLQANNLKFEIVDK